MRAPKVTAVSVCHMMPEIVAFSLAKGNRTIGDKMKNAIQNWGIMDHHWPMAPFNRNVGTLVKRGVILEPPDKNIGGHEGINWCLKGMSHTINWEDDFILLYDPDSNPVTQDWGDALLAVMEADPSIPYLSLMPTVVSSAFKARPDLRKILVGGHIVCSSEKAEMINVTLWRAKHLRGGLKAIGQFYGGVEALYFDVLKVKGSYLAEFYEDPCPIAHPKTYTEWKTEHAMERYKGNFDEWIKELGRDSPA